MGWRDWMRMVEVEPSLYAADFARLGEQVEVLLRAGARVFHFDVGDGHFVEPIIIGPIVLESVAEGIHEGGGFVDVHLMVEAPERYFEPFRKAGADSVTFHIEAVDDVAAAVAAAHGHGLAAGVAFKPATPVEAAAGAAAEAGAELVLCMSIEPGYSGQAFMPEAYERLRRTRELLPEQTRVQVDGGVHGANIARAHEAGADLLVAATAVFGGGEPARSYGELVAAAG
jgi:ribulose-phosphate 3-epimerase